MKNSPFLAAMPSQSWMVSGAPHRLEGEENQQKVAYTYALKILQKNHPKMANFSKQS